MYLWIVIATFITLLYSLNLGFRADYDRVLAETKAQVILTKFLAQHNAVKEYLNEQAPEKTGLTRVPYYPGDGYNSTTGANFASDGSEVEGGKNYKIEVDKYLPYGYEPDEETVTKVFCIKDGEINGNGAQCQSAADGSCCSDPFTGIYVVSFRQIPSRWFNHATNMPNADLIGSMIRVYGYGRFFGYLDKIDGKLSLAGGDKWDRMVSSSGEGQENAAETFENQRVFQYRQVLQAVLDDKDFKEKECDKAERHCLYAIWQIYG